MIIKIPGFSRGIGVIRVDSSSSLYSTVDYLLATSVAPYLCTYINNPIHWRLAVIGDKAVAACRNQVEAGDFRSYAGVDPADYFENAGQSLLAVAIQACQALRVEFGGVDILEHSSGRLYPLEANFPCYFATA